MKIEIFKLITENIDRLNPLDFAIIFVICFLVVLTCYRFFRWIYKDVFESQKKSLEVKNGIISDLEKKATLIEEQKGITEERMIAVSDYALFLKGELQKIHLEKTKIEKEHNQVKNNAFILQFGIVLLLLGKSLLNWIESDRNIIIANMLLAAQGKIPKNENSVLHLVRLAEIGKKVIDGLSTVDALGAVSPEDAYLKLSSSKFSVPELANVDLISVREEIKKIDNEIVKPHLEIIRGHLESSESKS